MKSILLTGASGFIGRHCLPLLVSGGYTVHAVARNPLHVQGKNLSWHCVDLKDYQQSVEIVRALRPEYLLHLAWGVEPEKYWGSLDNVRWLEISLNLLRAFVENGGRRVVVAGTCAEYDWRYGYCSEDLTPLLPSTLYGSCKKSLYCLLEAVARETEALSAAWGRVFFVYGPYEKAQRLIPSIICPLLRGESAVCKQGNQIRDFLYVHDVANALVRLLESSVIGAVNISSGLPVKLMEIAHKIAEKLDCEDRLKVEEDMSASPAAPPLLIGDARRLTKEVGWQPRFSLDTGLDQVIEWWKGGLCMGNGISE